MEQVKKNKQIGLVISEETKAKMDYLKKHCGLNLSQFIRLALDQEYERQLTMKEGK